MKISGTTAIPTMENVEVMYRAPDNCCPEVGTVVEVIRGFQFINVIVESVDHEAETFKGKEVEVDEYGEYVRTVGRTTKKYECYKDLLSDCSRPPRKGVCLVM